MRAERNLVQIPEARLVVVRIRQVVQFVPLDEFLQRLALRAAAFHIADESVGERDFPAREKSAVPLRARDHAVHARDRLALQIFLLEGRIAHERVAEAPGRLIREHIEMSPLIRAGGPPLRHVVGDVGVEIEPLGIFRLHAIHVDERLEQLLFGELPHVAWIRRHLALQRVDIVGDEGAEELVGHRVQLAPQTGAATLAPEDAANLGMRRQIFLDAVADRVARLIIGVGRGAGVGVLAARRFAARPLALGRVVHDLAGLSREQLFVDLGAPRLEPCLRLRRVGELILDPLRGLVDPGLRDVAPLFAPRLPRRGVLPGLAGHVGDERHVRRDFPLRQRARDRVEHHRVGLVRGDDQHRLARLQDAHALALQARLVAHERSRGAHQVVDRLRRLEVRRPARLGIRVAGGGAGAPRGTRRVIAAFVRAAARGGDDRGDEEHQSQQLDGAGGRFHRLGPLSWSDHSEHCAEV